MWTQLFVFVIVFHCVFTIDNGLARTPAMGYNTWNDFRCNIKDSDIRGAADSIVRNGLDKLGYQYVNIDDCWAKGRFSNGTVYPDSATFPNGIKAVADYVHSLGLKFGIYTDRGTYTCAKRPGSEDYEKIDASTYAEWGVDYLKEDSCFASPILRDSYTEYSAMRNALNETGRPIYFSLCGWNTWYSPVGFSLGNSWRIAGDCNTWYNVLNALDQNAPLYSYAGPGGWNDPDMLLGSDARAAVYLTQNQSRSMFSLWSIVAAPLLIGSNINNLGPWDLETYSNKEIIDVNQDSLGKQGMRIQGGHLIKQFNVYTSVAPCTKSSEQLWSYNDEYSNAFNNDIIGRCINVEDCASALIYYPCEEGKNLEQMSGCPIQNQQFSFSNGKLTSFLRDQNECITLLPDGQYMGLGRCSDDPRQQWNLVQVGVKYMIQSKHNNMCVTAQTSNPPESTQNIWARPLESGSWAITFLNNAKTPTSMTCDKTCFSKMGFTSSTTTIKVRNLWTHTDLPNTTIDKPFQTETIGSNGGSATYKFTPMN